MLSAIEIIEGFGKIMTGYLLFMDHSEIVRKSKYMDTILYNGANIVIHVFTMHVYSNHSLENIYIQCGKSYVCYLEYIEQLDKTNLANNLYISDISIFVYKLTLGELASSPIRYEENANGSKVTDCSKKDCIDLVVKTWNTLLAWNSCMSFNARLAICDVQVTRYAKLFHNILVYQPFMDYLGIVQEKWAMDENVYFAFLNEYYRRIYKLKHANKLPYDLDMSEKILLFCTQYHLEYDPTEDNMRSIVSILL
uniref:Uncharacterized protein n=1 Tax=viral metagenome TaxID=1070528 RepID=A0A6C0K221_9ZZZZ